MLRSFLVCFLVCFLGCFLGAQRVPKGSPKGSKIDEKEVSKRYLKKGPKKASKMMIFWTPQCGSSVVNNSNIVFFCFHFCTLLGHISGSFLEPKWRSKAWKSGSQKSFKNMSKKWSIFDRFWGPFGVQNGTQNRSKIGHFSSRGSWGSQRFSRSRFWEDFLWFFGLFWSDFGHF